MLIMPGDGQISEPVQNIKSKKYELKKDWSILNVQSMSRKLTSKNHGIVLSRKKTCVANNLDTF